MNISKRKCLGNVPIDVEIGRLTPPRFPHIRSLPAMSSVPFPCPAFRDSDCPEAGFPPISVGSAHGFADAGPRRHYLNEPVCLCNLRASIRADIATSGLKPLRQEGYVACVGHVVSSRLPRPTYRPAKQDHSTHRIFLSGDHISA